MIHLPLPLFLRRLLRLKPRTAWFSHPLLYRLETVQNHPDSPLRLPALEAELKRQRIWPRLMKRDAVAADDKALALVHTRSYLRRLEAIVPHDDNIRRLDDDTVLVRNSLDTARLAAGAVVRAVDYVLAGKANNAFCAIRPPGHHAESSKSGSFCLINNIAVGVMHALSRHRLNRIAILDFDIHRGNGTEEIFADEDRVLLLGMSQNSLYPYNNEASSGSNPHQFNLALPDFTDSATFRRLIKQEWLPRLKAFKPEMIFLSAGFDGHRDESLGDAKLHEADYAWLTHKIMQAAPQCKGKIVSVLEGGYNAEAMSRSAAAHLYVLTGMGKPPVAVKYEKELKKPTA
ncbi:MAG: histone deacetylase family protein [Neisseria sp.]|nr:histone deacetylase family protein [Neisseria sp.]